MEEESTIDHDKPEPARIPARALAAFIDYLLLFALMQIISIPGLSLDWQFLSFFFVGGIYFSIGNSVVTGGQTLGKRVFGLRVEPYLSLSKSFLRYFFTYGILILVSELPTVLFRQSGTIAPSTTLEFHMLLTLCYFFANVGQTVFSRTHMSLHDMLAGTIVMQDPCGIYQVNLNQAKQKLHGAIIGVIIGSILWTVGIQQPEIIETVKQHRFALEKNFPVRFLQAKQTEKGVSIMLLLTESNDEESFIQLTDELSFKIATYLKDTEIFMDKVNLQLNFNFFYPKDDTLPEGQENPRVLSVNLASLDKLG